MVCRLSHLCILFKPFNRLTCHLVGRPTLAASNYTLLHGVPGPRRCYWGAGFNLPFSAKTFTCLVFTYDSPEDSKYWRFYVMPNYFGHLLDSYWCCLCSLEMCDKAKKWRFFYFEYTSELLIDRAVILFHIDHHCSKCLTVYIVVVRRVENELIDDRRSTICLHIPSLLIQRRRDHNSNDLLNSHNRPKAHVLHFYCSLAQLLQIKCFFGLWLFLGLIRKA